MAGKWRVMILMLLIICLLVGFFYRQIQTGKTERSSALIARQMPNFDLPELSDSHQSVNQKTLEGTPYLLNVWGSWCPSCVEEMPQLLQLQQAGVRIMGLNYKDQKKAALDFLKLYGNPYALNLVDHEGQLAFDLGVYGAPESFLINAKGIIVYHHSGVITASVLNQKILPLWQQETKCNGQK